MPDDDLDTDVDPRYAELIAAAEEDLAAGRLEETIQSAAEAISVAPDEPDAHFLAGVALLELGHHRDARRVIENAARLAPDDVDVLIFDAATRFVLGDGDGAGEVLRRVLADVPDHPDAHYWMSLVIERDGDYAQADVHLARAAELDPEAYAPPFRLERDDFGASLEELVATLPQPIREALVELPMVIEDLPSAELLAGSEDHLAPDILGLFVGASLAESSVFDGVPPMNVVYLFKRNLERIAQDREQLLEEARVTLVHEIGHYLGLDEDELHDRDLH